MKVLVFTRTPLNKYFEEGIVSVSFNDLLKKSDIISIHVPLNSETKNMIALKELKKMKKTAFLINTARGGVVNEKDLYKALIGKIIQGAAADVFEKEKHYSNLFELDNFVATPHIGAMTHESQKQIGAEVVRKLKELFFTY